MNNVYSKDEFIITSIDNEFIVINKKKRFKYGHTHIRNFKTAKYLIDMVSHKRIPYHLPVYLLVSLRRLSDDEVYAHKIAELIENKKNKRMNYVNRV